MFKNATLGSAKVFLLLSLFFVSFSTALINVFGSLLLLSFILAAIADKSLLRPLRLSPAILTLLLCAMLILACSWSVAPRDEVFQALIKYRKWLFLPIALALVWNDGRLARTGFLSFLGGAAFLALGCYLVWFNMLPVYKFDWWKVGTPENAFAFKSYITIGILLGFAAGACWAYCIYANTWRMRMASIISGLLFAFPIIFLMNGRTGYIVVLSVCIGLIALRSGKNWKRLFAGLIAVGVIFAAVFAMSGNMEKRTNGMLQEVHNYSQNQELNSSGIRMTFYKAGWHMFLAHPFFGTGTASFAENFSSIAKKMTPPPGDPDFARSQPHSEVVLMAVQLGIVGLGLYFALLATLALVVRKQKSYQADLLFLLCICFAVPACFNSLMWDVTEGHWFALLAGCLYAAARRGDAATIMMKRSVST